MDLLPKTRSEFNQKDYWNTFFQKRGNKAFEWYGEYAELCGQLHKYIRPKDDILVVGCGNSTLSSDLFDVGHKQITNIDISQVVIRNMIGINKSQRPEMVFLQMDATKMTFSDCAFSVVLDKGTLDALMPDDSEPVNKNVDDYFSEINRILRLTGRYICISLLQEHILRKIVNTFANKYWMLRVIRCHEAEQKNSDAVDGNLMPVFIVVATKFKQLPESIVEVCLAGNKMQRLKIPSEVHHTIKSLQEAAVVTNGLSRNSLADLNEVVMDLSKPGEDSTRYSVFVLDQVPTRQNGKFACFIVPQGRETDWLFGTYDGRRQLLRSAKHNRLAIVTMHRGQHYEDWNTVKKELSDCIRTLAPKGCGEQIPFLSLGADVGTREICYKGVSDQSGEFIIEDVKVEDDNWFRRLIFLNNQFAIQSEAKLLKASNPKEIRRVDHSYLACDYHTYMCVGVQLALSDKSSIQNRFSEIAVVGLGGGSLCAFLHKYIKRINISAVEIDESIFKLAIDYFDLRVSNTLSVHIEDGINFIENSANKGKLFKAILFDVDSKDKSVGMSFPPQNFLEKHVLDSVSKCLGDTGYFILNLVCRNEELLNGVFKSLQKSFQHIAFYKLQEDVNRIVYCTNKSIVDWKENIKRAAETQNTSLSKMKIGHSAFVCASDLSSSLTVLPEL